jgi:hypothetical protein
MYTKTLILFFLSLFSFSLLPAETEAQPIVSFKYAFLCKHGDEEVKALDNNELSTRLATGDKIKVFFKPVKDAYIYLFFQDTNDELYMLFPEAICDFNSYKLSKNYYVPKGDDWFVVDDSKGTDRFYLLVSGARLSKLEELSTQYLEQYYSTKKAEDKISETRQLVVEEIKRIRLARAAEKNVKESITLVACDFRGMGSQYEFQAINVETEGFYAKTIRIEH